MVAATIPAQSRNLLRGQNMPDTLALRSGSVPTGRLILPTVRLPLTVEVFTRNYRQLFQASRFWSVASIPFTGLLIFFIEFFHKGYFLFDLFWLIWQS